MEEQNITKIKVKGMMQQLENDFKDSGRSKLKSNLVLSHQNKNQFDFRGNQAEHTVQSYAADQEYS